MERRDRLREGDAALVVVLLDRCAHDAGDADAVAAISKARGVARFVEEPVAFMIPNTRGAAGK